MKQATTTMSYLEMYNKLVRHAPAILNGRYSTGDREVDLLVYATHVKFHEWSLREMILEPANGLAIAQYLTSHGYKRAISMEQWVEVALKAPAALPWVETQREHARWKITSNFAGNVWTVRAIHMGVAKSFEDEFFCVEKCLQVMREIHDELVQRGAI